MPSARGQGLEGDLPDAYAKRIIDETMTPLFQSGDISAGILLGVRGIVEKTNPSFKLGQRLNTHSSTSMVRGKKKSSLSAKIFQGLIFLLMLFFFIRNPILFCGLPTQRENGSILYLSVFVSLIFVEEQPLRALQ